MFLLKTVKNNKGGVTVCILQTTENLCCCGEHKLPNWRFMQEISLESSSLLVPGTHWKIALK
jgi:hypothetical protein